MVNDIEKQKEHFESIADTYHKMRQEKKHLLLKSLMWANFFDKKKHIFNRKISALEPMCGYSEGKKILESYSGADIDYYEAFDFSEKMVSFAKSNYPNSNIYLQDITKFQSNKKFDVIILISSLHHVYRHTQDVLKRLNSSLKDGGFFINCEPTHNFFLTQKIREKIYKEHNFFDDNTEQGYWLDELNKMYKNAGFEIVDQFYPGLLSYILYYNPDAFPKLNKGWDFTVKFLFNLDRCFMRNFIGKKLSFFTISLLRKI
ncbi:methyltransferase domain-containing protein [bacterium]|jgi:SAM-dependent methyltransferase|nr:methyltransferase domain-containing protein [bacterium]